MDYAKEAQHIVDWIKEYFVNNGNKDTKAIIGISGGKDSTVCAAACIKALGVDRVVGVLMPSVKDNVLINDPTFKEGKDVIKALGIEEYYQMNIYHSCQNIYDKIKVNSLELKPQTKINTPARIRMATLYAIASEVGGRVCNTCNYSENYVGYSTKYGDHAGDFSPLQDYTVKEVLEIGKHLGVPDELLYRVPSDGLCGTSDEANLGFTYETLDNYLMNDIIPEYEILRKIEEKHKMNKHKLCSMPFCHRSRENDCMFSRRMRK